MSYRYINVDSLQTFIGYTELEAPIWYLLPFSEMGILILIQVSAIGIFKLAISLIKIGHTSYSY